MGFFRKKQNLPTNFESNNRFWNRRRKKILFWTILGFVIAIVLWVTVGYSFASKMFTTNFSGGSAFLKLFGKDDQLKGEGDGRINILLTGIGGNGHPGGNLTDSIMILSIDPTNKTMAMLSIPRDLYVKTADFSGGKINQVYSDGEKNGEGHGGEAIKNVVSEILDLPIHYYANVDFQGFIKFVDILGGVTINVDNALYDPYYPDYDMVGYSPLRVKAGEQKMDGALALKYARSRQTTSDFDRSRRQQQVIEAIQDKALSIGFLSNPKKILDTLSTLGDHVKTDFSTLEIERLVSIIKDLDRSKTVSKVLQTGSGGELYSDSSSGTFYLYPNGDSYEVIQKIAHEIFSDPDLKREDAKIEVLNGSSTAGLALKLSETLRSYGYNIVRVDNTDKVEKTIICDYSNGGKEFTLNFLMDRLDASVVKRERSKDSTTDIVIIIGKDYQEKSVNLKEGS